MSLTFSQGKTHFEQANYQEAIACFTQVLTENPLHVDGLYWRGLCRYKLQEYQKAIKDYDDALNISTHNANLYYERGLAQHMLNHREEALQDFDKALVLDPQNPFRYASRAFVKAAYNMIQEAIEDYIRALELDPEDAITQNNLGLLYERIGYKAEAQALFAKADKVSGLENNGGKVYYEENLSASKKEANTSSVASSPTINHQSTTRWQIVKQVFTTKATFKAFIDYWKKRLKA